MRYYSKISFNFAVSSLPSFFLSFSFLFLSIFGNKFNLMREKFQFLLKNGMVLATLDFISLT